MTPLVTNKKIRDLIPEVRNVLQGRTDIDDVAPFAIKRALQEYTVSFPFEELRVTGPQVQLTPSQPVYPISFFLNSGDDYTSPESFVILVDYPSNTVQGSINYRTPKAIEGMLSPATRGIPSRFTRYGMNFMLGPVPDQAYTVFLRYQVKHPFPTDDAALAGADMYVPDDWEEIIAYAAALRIARSKRWTDQVKDIHDSLFGDPEAIKSEGKFGRPGLLSARLAQVERDERFNTRQLSITVPRYNSR